MERTFTNGAVKDCCREGANLELLAEESNAETGLTVRRCRVCGCRHRRLYLEPGAVGARVMSLGKRAAEERARKRQAQAEMVA